MPKKRAVRSGPPKRLLPHFERQQLRKWCWAAVGVTVAKLFDPASTLRQCELANERINQTICCADSPPDACNVTHTMFNVLLDLGLLNLGQQGGGPLPWDDIAAEIDEGRPLVCTIEWSDLSTHYVCIDGYDKATRTLSVCDPFDGHHFVSYDTFASAYKGTGRWTEYFRTKRAA